MPNSSGPHRREERYAEVVETFGGALERLARAYERDAERRRDLLQDIHVAVWQSLARFDGRCSLRTWVYRVAHNTSTSKAIRSRRRGPTLVALDDTLATLAEATDDERQLDRRRALDRLYDLIRRLAPLDRQVMVLYLEELDAASIAEITGLSAANVATKVSRIKKILIRQFHGAGRDGD